MEKTTPDYRKEQKWKQEEREMERQKFADIMKQNKLAREKAEREASIKKQWDTMNEVESIYQKITEAQEASDPATPIKYGEQAKTLLQGASPEVQAILQSIQTPADFNEFVSQKTDAEKRMIAEGFLKAPTAKEKTERIILVDNTPGSPTQQLAEDLNLRPGERVRVSVDDNMNPIAMKTNPFSADAEEDEGEQYILSNVDGHPNQAEAVRLGVAKGRSVRAVKDGNKWIMKGNPYDAPKPDDPEEEFSMAGLEKPSAYIPKQLEGKDILGLAHGVESSVQATGEGFTFTSEGFNGEDNVRARQVMAGLKKQIEMAYINSDRVPVNERMQVDSLNLTDIEGAWYKSSSSVRAKLETSLEYMQRQYDTDLSLAQNPSVERSVRTAAAKSVRELGATIAQVEAVLSSGQQKEDGDGTPDDIQDLLDKYK